MFKIYKKNPNSLGFGHFNYIYICMLYRTIICLSNEIIRCVLYEVSNTPVGPDISDIITAMHYQQSQMLFNFKYLRLLKLKPKMISL